MGAPYEGFAPSSKAGALSFHSGSDGALLLRTAAPSGARGFSRTIVPAGDLDGDGLPDVWVGAAQAVTPLMGTHGALYAISGSNGSVLYRLIGATPDEFGSDVVGMGDLDGDGRGDVLPEKLTWI